MGGTHRRADLPLTQELVDSPGVRAIHEQAGGNGMPHRVTAGWFHHPGYEPSLFHRPRESRNPVLARQPARLPRRLTLSRRHTPLFGSPHRHDKQETSLAPKEASEVRTREVSKLIKMWLFDMNRGELKKSLTFNR